MQTRLKDFQDPLLSFEHNLVSLGLNSPGRFCGFDVIEATGQFQFSLKHSVNSITIMDTNGNPKGPLGIAMTRQGLVVVEDAPITGLAIATNLGNAFPRVDLIVMNHQYIEIANGLEATYSVIKGPDGGPVEPMIGLYQVILGRIFVPASSVSVADGKYTKSPSPDSGDGPDARLDKPNNYNRTNQNALDPTAYQSPEKITSSGSLWTLRSLGNSYQILPNVNADVDGLRIADEYFGPANLIPKDGVEINIIINEFVRLRNNRDLLQPELDEAYCPIIFATRLVTAVVNEGGNDIGILQPGPGGLWIITLVRYSKQWIVKGIDGIGFNPGLTLPSKMVFEVDFTLAEVLTNFVTSGPNAGLGIGSWAGRALCNGNNGTRDRRGRVSVMGNNGLPGPANTVPFSFSIGSASGEALHKLLDIEMPSKNITIPGQTGGDNNDNNNTARFGGGDKAPSESAFFFDLILQNPFGGLNIGHNNLQPYLVSVFVMVL